MKDIRNGFEGSRITAERIEERVWKKQYPALFALTTNANSKGERWESKQYTIFFGGKQHTVVNLTASTLRNIFPFNEKLLDAILDSFSIVVY